MDYKDLTECPYCTTHFTELVTKETILHCPMCHKDIPEEETDE